MSKYLILAYSTCTYDLAQPSIHPTLITNIFPSKCTHSRCLDIMPGSRPQAVQISLTSVTNSYFVGDVDGRLFQNSRFHPLHSNFLQSPAYRSTSLFGLRFGILLCVYSWLIMIVMCRYHCLMPLRRHCLLDLLTRLLIDAAQLCARRMSSLKYHNHINCVKCSVIDCFVHIPYSKYVKWFVQFILACVNHQRTFVRGWES